MTMSSGNALPKSLGVFNLHTPPPGVTSYAGPAPLGARQRLPLGGPRPLSRLAAPPARAEERETGLFF